jgi:hypothetical protein
MHSTRMQKFGMSQPDPESTEKPEIPGKSLDSLGFLSTREKQHSSTIFNLTYNILRK